MSFMFSVEVDTDNRFIRSLYFLINFLEKRMPVFDKTLDHYFIWLTDAILLSDTTKKIFLVIFRVVKGNFHKFFQLVVLTNDT